MDPEILMRLDDIEARLQRLQQDVDESLQTLLPWCVVLWRRDAATKLPRGCIEDPADAAANIYAWLAARKAR